MKTKKECEEYEWLKKYITTTSDFPKPGITFQWYGKLFQDPSAFIQTIKIFADRYRHSNINKIAGLDSRGFIFAAPLSYELAIPLCLIRKPKKLPGEVESIHYNLEYGSDKLEIEKNSIAAKDQVLVIDDILATGGTAQAACDLIEKLGAYVFESAFLLELSHLAGRNKFAKPIFSILTI